MSVWSAQKSASLVVFHFFSHVILQEKIHFVYLLESLGQGDSNKYIKGMIHKKNCPKVSVIHALDVSTSSFIITANSI